MIALAVALSLLGVLLVLVGAVYLVGSTWRLRAQRSPDPGLGGPRGVAAGAVLFGVPMTGGASLLGR